MFRNNSKEEIKLAKREEEELDRFAGMKTNEKLFIIANQKRVIEGLIERLKEAPFNNENNAEYSKLIMQKITSLKRRNIINPHEQIIELRHLAAEQLKSNQLDKMKDAKFLFKTLLNVDITDPYEFHEFAKSAPPIREPEPLIETRKRSESKRKPESSPEPAHPPRKRRDSIFNKNHESSHTNSNENWNKLIEYLSRAENEATAISKKKTINKLAYNKWRSLAVMHNLLTKPVDINITRNFIQYCRLHRNERDERIYPEAFQKVFTRDFLVKYVYKVTAAQIKDEKFLEAAMNEINRLKGASVNSRLMRKE